MVWRALKRQSILAVPRHLGIWWFEIWKYHKRFSNNKWLRRTGIVRLNRFEKPTGSPRIPDQEGQPSISRRYKYIPKEMQQKVVDKYFDYHKGNSRRQHLSPILVINIRHRLMSRTFDKFYFRSSQCRESWTSRQARSKTHCRFYLWLGWNSRNQLFHIKKIENFLEITGKQPFSRDLGFRLPSYEQSLIYAEARVSINLWRHYLWCHRSDVIGSFIKSELTSSTIISIQNFPLIWFYEQIIHMELVMVPMFRSLWDGTTIQENFEILKPISDWLSNQKRAFNNLSDI